MPTVSGPILDSSGNPANGWIRVKATRPFDITAGLVTTAQALVTVRNGQPTVAGGPWTPPVTPDDVRLNLEQDLDGEEVRKFSVIVPDMEKLTYSELLFYRGTPGAGAGPFLWDLTGGLDFPPEAVAGVDFGYDALTGDVWRYDP